LPFPSTLRLKELHLDENEISSPMRQRRAVAIVGVRFEHCVDNFQDTTIGKARL